MGEFILQGDDTIFRAGSYIANNSPMGIKENRYKSSLYLYGEKFFAGGAIATDFSFEADDINTVFERVEIV